MRSGSENKEALRNIAVDQVKAMIINGEYAPGQPIRESDISKKLNISRAPVREVFRFLEREGLVEYIPNCGVRVKRLTKKDIQEIYSVRMMLDLFIADEIFAHISPTDISELDFLVQRMGDRKNYSLCNDLFHNKLFMLSKNSRIRQFWNMMEGQVCLIMNSCASSDQLFQISVPLHRAIVDALQIHDKDAYKQAVRRHTEVALKYILELVDQDPI